MKGTVEYKKEFLRGTQSETHSRHECEGHVLRNEHVVTVGSYIYSSAEFEQKIVNSPRDKHETCWFRWTVSPTTRSWHR